jgi:peptidoglycan/xylan/chitin deacetylase (PgdA/CDA1 family)
MRRAQQRRRTARRRRLIAASGALACAGIAGAIVFWPSGSRPPVATRTPRVSTAPRPAPRRTGADRLPTAAAQRAEIDHLRALGLPIYRAGGKGHYVALTFDDGPGPYTATALRALRENHARATFFLVGRNLATWPQVTREEAALGAIGDHSWTHPYLPNMSAAQVTDEIVHTRAAAAETSGAPVLLFRPPYGGHNAAIDATARRAGMLEVLWSTDSRDALGDNWEQILKTSKDALRPGAIILLHENRGQTLKALNRLLPELRRRHLQAVSVPELLALDPPTDAQVRADSRRFAIPGGS